MPHIVGGRGGHPPNQGRSRGGNRGRGFSRGRGRGRGRALVNSPRDNQPSSTAEVDFDGDFQSFNLFASQFQPPARAKLRRGSGRIAVAEQDERNTTTRRISSRGLGYTKPLPRADPSFQRWQADRPLLQPIKFVPAVTHRTLFEKIDEILEIPHDSSNEDKPVPTSELLDIIFKHAKSIDLPATTSSSSTDLNGDAVVPIPSTDDAPKPAISETTTRPPQTNLPLSTTNSPLTGNVHDDDDVIVYHPLSQSCDIVDTVSVKLSEANLADVFAQNSKTPTKADPPPEKGDREAPSSGNAKQKQRRRNGSDIDWGDTESRDSAESGLSDMLDPDVDQPSFSSFLLRISDGRREGHVTIDDLADIHRLRAEDAAHSNSPLESASDDCRDEDVNSENDLVESDEDSSNDDGSFDARLRHIRARKLKPGFPDDFEDDFEEYLTLSDDETDFIAHIEGVIDKGAFGSRKERHQVFSTLVNSEYKSLGKTVLVPPQLQEQWQRDRAKKAEFKRNRQLARMSGSGIWDSRNGRKHGKKSNHGLVQAGMIDPESALPGKTDLQTLESRIRNFVDDLSGPESLILPPMAKETRAVVHQLAEAFHLKSKSRGKGESRFTTLFKTSKTGINIKGWKVDKLVHGTYGISRTGPAKHREGDEVGRAAPKIGEGNLGFRMLQQMGWEEGERIGTTSGLEAPLVAKIKNTKRGLGAL